MAYKDYADSYVKWLQSQLDYVKGSAYSNFSVTITPTYEVTSFKQSTDTRQQRTFHNAADDQVATLRALKEIGKNPSDYLSEYSDYVTFEMAQVQAQATKVENLHSIQNTSDTSALQFYSTFAAEVMANYGTYNPTRILS